MKISSHSKHFTVRLHETDLGAIVHHSNYFHWIEETEYAFFEAIDEPVVGEFDENNKGTGWPRAEMNVKFLRPLRFRDQVRVDLSIKKIRSAGIIYSVEIYKINPSSEELVLKGSYSAICCLYSSDGESNPEAIPIPDRFLNKISTCE
ncbi:thioesterase family protein [Lentisphaera profundi]|uniref:Thioesterase family protein n=1 Tax=Lentisphaera profundi TaxID=1658616 RepID=A0ABY7VXL2_9BACT|nr:thioesterase family protein [Lentisphaera profundi]WDE98991.1 thioesterase family protein [Lentisphaera profundi]